MIQEQEIHKKIIATAYPAFKMLIVVITFFSFALLYHWNFKAWVIALFVGSILILICFLKKFFTSLYCIGCALFGIWLALNIQQVYVPAPPKIIPEMKAVAQGRIIQVLKEDASYGRYIVEGTLDAESLRRFKNTRILLSINKKTPREKNIHAGSDIVANLLVRPPSPKTLPTDFAEREYAASLDVQWFGRSKAQDVTLMRYNYTLESWRNDISRNILLKLSSLYPESTLGIMYALITGDKTLLTPEIRQSYSLAGTSHLLAVSGFHVTIIAAGIFLLLGILKDPWLRFSIFVVALSAFIILTGLQASAIRSAVMAMLFMLAITLQRHPNITNITALSALLILLIWPHFLLSAGFQMSVGAILGIALLYTPTHDFFGQFFKGQSAILHYIISSISLTIAASIAVVPIVAYYFETVTFISPLTNIAAIPIIGLAMIWGTVSLILSYVFVPAAKIFAVAGSDMIHLANIINDFGLKIPNAFLQGSESVIVATALSLGLLYLMLSGNKRQAVFRFATVATASTLIFIVALQPKKETVKIFPRDYYTAYVIPLKTNRTAILMMDHKPKLYPQHDMGMERFLKEMKGKILMGTRGNASEFTMVNVKKEREVTVLKTDSPEFDRIVSKIAAKKGFKNKKQIIELQ